MVQLGLPGFEEYQEDVPLDTDDVKPVNSPFQQELRTHLMVIQRRLDSMVRILDETHLQGAVKISGTSKASSRGSSPADSFEAAVLAAQEEPLPPQQPASILPPPAEPAKTPKQGLMGTLGTLARLTKGQENPDQPIQNLDFVLPNSPMAGARIVPETSVKSGKGEGGVRREHSGPRTPRKYAQTSGDQESQPPPPRCSQSSTSMTPPDIPTHFDDGAHYDEEPHLSDNNSLGALQMPEAGGESPQRRNGPRMARASSEISGDRLRLGRLRSWLNLQTENGGVQTTVDRIGMRRMVSKAADYIATRWVEAQDRWLWQLVNGVGFQIMCSSVIVLNVVMIGVIANDRLESGLQGRPEEPAWQSVEIGFCVFFGLELVVRAAAEKILFLIGPEWKWNLFDTGLVLFSVADIILNAATTVAISNVTTARILRFVRFIRIIRIARAVRAFHSLRIVVFAIFESMMSLIWCFLVVGLIIYMFAILFLYGVTEHMSSPERANNADLMMDLLQFYGSVPTACLTLFMTISGGVDWHEAMHPLQAIHWVYQPLFTFYVFTMVIGVMNVVMGAFVASTAEISSKDRDCLVKNEMQNQQMYIKKIKTFFQEADRDRSGLLSWNEFREHLKMPKVSAYFRALELDVSQAHVLFKLLDRDGSSEVSLDEFLAGCFRLKGQAKSLEVNMLLYENRRLFAKMSNFMEAITDYVLPPTPTESRRNSLVSGPSPLFDD